MNQPGTVAVIGLGLMGGSVARALIARGVRVLGYDSNAAHLDGAGREGVTPLSPSLDDVGEADTIVIAVHGDSSIEFLEALGRAGKHARLITDVGSTKQRIVSSAEKLELASRFVGSHPLAGDHQSGWGASREDLFENQIVYLCPTAKSDPATIELARSFWSLLGATTVQIDATAHDELLAWTSHLPHVVSTALATALGQKGIARDQLGRGGRDVTRLAGGSVEMWTAILLENAPAIGEAFAGVERELAEVRDALRTNDRTRLNEIFRQAREWSTKR